MIYTPFFDHEDATIYTCGVQNTRYSNHNEDCGCTLYVDKALAQQHLIAELENFITRNQAAIDDAKVRIAQIKKAMEND